MMTKEERLFRSLFCPRTLAYTHAEMAKKAGVLWLILNKTINKKEWCEKVANPFIQKLMIEGKLRRIKDEFHSLWEVVDREWIKTVPFTTA